MGLIRKRGRKCTILAIWRAASIGQKDNQIKAPGLGRFFVQQLQVGVNELVRVRGEGQDDHRSPSVLRTVGVEVWQEVEKTYYCPDSFEGVT